MSDPDPKHMKGTPIWFAREILGLEPYPWQERVLWDLAVGDKPVVLKAANGSGKTQGIAAVAVLWHAAVFPNSQVVTTAGVYRQVKEQLWGNLRQYKGKLGPGWTINTTDLEAPNGSKGIGFSTDDPNKFEGFHNDNLLIILDEAKSIPDELWEAVQRCNAPRVRILIMSSTGSAEGFFPEAFHSKRRFFSTHSITSFDCPHISDNWVQQQIDYWGKDHPLVRSMIYSEFIAGNESQFVVPPLHYANCLDNPPEVEPGQKLAFIDWAAGGDENVFCVIEGNKVHPLVCWRDKDTMAAANRAAMEIIKHDVPRQRVFADDGGLGHPINDALASRGFPVRRVLNNMRPNSPDHFANFGAELWYTASRHIEKQSVILPDDDILREQCTTRRSLITANGKLALEKKDDMKNRGLTSPDRADAVLTSITLAKTIGNEYDPMVDIWNGDPESSDSQTLTAIETEQSGHFPGL